MSPLLLTAEVSKVPFFILGGALAVWAVVVAGLGLRNPSFPGAAARERVVMLISLVMAALAVGAAVVTG